MTANLSHHQQCDPSFEWLRSEPIASLHVVVSEFRHRVTGALHYHIAADNDENVFLVALRTIPQDSTGVAHILEHTALCGSEQYPVRDPFFMMIRRSLNTFMNAFTSSDWTAYPFASKNRKDFINLANIYLDAVFFSRLDPLDFAQEGHRLEFEEANNTQSPLVYKGVVYNEMKGAMSSPVSVLYQKLTHYLFPTSTYHYNSGGDPAAIPDLSYDELRAFYSRHYHPSNSVFMTYGDVPAAEHQARFQERALHRFEALNEQIAVTPETRFTAPQVVEDVYPHQFQAGESRDNKTHITLAWLLGKSTDLESQLKAHLLTDVLLDNSAAPLRRLLETCGLGSAPSPLCGLEDSNLEMTFICGLEGASPDVAPELEQKVLALLTELSETGIAEAQLEAALHQLELTQREVGGDHYPYGLQMIMNAISPAVHRGDPIAVLNLDPVLDSLRAAIKDPEFIKQLIKTELLDNPHRLRLTLIPDATQEAKEKAAERDQLDALAKQLNDNDKQHIVAQTQALQERQNQEDDIDVLPKVGIDDVPPGKPMPTPQRHNLNDAPLTTYQQGTNGLVYHQIISPLPNLSPEERLLLPFYTRMFGELGVAEHDYLHVQNQISAYTGGIGSFSVFKAAPNNEQNASGYLIYSGKALERNQQPLAALLQQAVSSPRFDELERIRELVAIKRSRMQDSITGNGHGLAMLAASSQLSPCGALSHQLGGLAGIKHVQELDNSLNDTAGQQALAERLQSLHHHLQQNPKQFLVIGESDSLAGIDQNLAALWGNANHQEQTLQFNPTRDHVQQAWLTNTQVNFCAQAFATVPTDHPDAAALSVLAGVLRNGFLHRAIREQGGAYGGGASHDSSNATFRFYSYRDPRLTETLQDFSASVEWLLGKDLGYQAVEEAILGIVSSLDKPSSPAGEAKLAFQNHLFQRDDAFQERYRQRILATTENDLKRVATQYLQHPASQAVITNKSLWEAADVSGFEIKEV